MPGIIAMCLSFVFSQFYRTFLAVLDAVLATDLGMMATQLAYASSAWFVAFALFQFPVGYMLDTIGPRRTGAWLLFVFAGGGAILFSLANSPAMVIFAMGLIGIGCSSALMSPMYILIRTLEPARFATMMSIFVTFGLLGNVVSTEPLSLLVAAIGWRQSAHSGLQPSG